MNCVTICSSRGRPKLCARMIESFQKTASNDTRLFVYVDEQDPTVEEYRQVLKGVDHEIGPHKFMCHVLNYGAIVKFPGLDYYHEANDDHVFRTHHWNTLMQGAIKANGGWGIAYGLTDNLPTAIMVSGNIVRELGYWFPPAFQHHSCDLYIRDLVQEAGLGCYVPEVNIEHMHVVWGKAENDDNYRWVYSKEQQFIGESAYQEWVDTNKESDIASLRKAMKA
jgi:hypothetical protein